MATNSTANAILDVAQSLCQSRGFNAFSYKDIARELGIRSASVHYHFPTKEDLGEALVRRYRSYFVGQLEGLSGGGTTARVQLETFAELMAGLVAEEKLCLCAMLASDYQTLGSRIQREVTAFFADVEAWIERTLMTGREEGSLSFHRTPRSVARGILASLQGLLMCSRAFRDASRFEDGRAWLLSIVT